MLTVAQYAAKISRNPRSVQGWCANGLIPGAVKTRIGRSSMYLIPEDAPVPQIGQGRPPTQCNLAVSPEPTGKNYTRKEICDFIVQNCTRMTYGQISRELGISAVEVRRIYNFLHEAYGI